MPTQTRATTEHRRTSTALAAAALVAAAVGSAAPDAGAASRCRPAGSTPVKSNAKVVVFNKRGLVYGCHRRSGRTVRLTPQPNVPHYYRIGRFRLAGTQVAYVITSHYDTGSQNSYDSRRQKIAVRDLSRRGAVRHAACEDRTLRPDWLPADGVKDLEVTASGAVAWIVRDPELDPRTLDVYVADAQGRRRLDRGDGIGERSLRIQDGTVTWLHDGQPRSAPLEDS